MQSSGDADGLLERLYALIGARDAAFVADLLHAFLEELPVTMARMAEALDGHDLEALRHEAHRLRSGAHALGGVGVAAASIPLEAAARAGETDGLPLLLNALEAEAVSYARTAHLLLARLTDAP